MRILPIQLCSEMFYYESEESLEDLKSELEILFATSKKDSLAVNLTGAFVSEYEFFITPQAVFGTFPRMIGEPAKLKGIIHKSRNGKTKIDILAIPHSIFILAFILFPIFTFVTMIELAREGRFSLIDSVLFALVFLVVSLAFLFLSALSKSSLQKRFISHFLLKNSSP